MGTGSGRHPAETPTSAIVYGTSRPLVNLVLYALAEDANAAFHWLDVRPSGEAPPELDPARLGWIDQRRVWTVDPLDALAPDNARANAALFELVRADEPPTTLARLSDFLRLPERMQQILAEMVSTGKPGVLAVANVHRTGKRFPDSTLGPILEAIAWAGYSLFVGYAGPEPSVRARFAHAVRVEGENPRRWRSAKLTLEGDSPMGALRVGEPTVLADLPFVARVLERALPEE